MKQPLPIYYIILKLILFHSLKTRVLVVGLMFLLSLVFPNTTFSQSGNFKTYGQDDGLTDLYIYTIAQDTLGYLWVGTGSGFMRFDGKTFENLPTQDGKENNFVKSSLTDKNGRLWSGNYNGGVSYYNPAQSKFVDFAMDSLIQTSVNQIVQGSGDFVWIVTQRSGVFKAYSDGSFERFVLEDFWLLFAIAELDNGKLALGTNEGIKIVSAKEGKITLLKSFDLLDDSEIHEIQPHFEGKGHWICTDNQGLILLDSEEIITQITKENGLPSNDIQTVLHKSEGELWIGTSDRGLLLYDSRLPEGNRVKKAFNKSTGEKDNYIKDLFSDREGNLWVGTYGAGIWIYRGGMFSFHANQNALRVYNLTQNSENAYLLGLEEGILEFSVESDQDVYTEFDKKNPLNNFKINASLTDNEGNIWVGTEGNGAFLKRKSDNKWIYLNEREDFNGNKIKSIALAKDNEIWLSTTLRGVYRYLPKSDKFKNYSTRTPLSENPQKQSFPDNVQSILPDSQGRVWLIMPGSGISYLQNGMLHLLKDERIKNVEFTCLTEDSEGLLWFGSSGFGAFNYDGRSFQNFTTNEGLLSKYIKTIGADSATSIWFGSSNGLTKYDIESKLFRVFGEDEGLIDVEISTNSYFLDRQGNSWFGTNKGALQYDPRKDNYNEKPPKTYLTRFRMNDKEVQTSDVMAFPYDIYKLEFDFIGLSLKDPEKVAYEYKLEGFDDEWRKTNDRNIVYPKIENGSYQFLLRSANSDGLWTEESVGLSLEIGKPIWKEPLFYIILVLLFGAGIYAYNRGRTLKLRRSNLILEEKVKARTIQIEKQKSSLVEVNSQLDSQNSKLESAYQKLVSLEEFKDQMTGMIVHDMKNPLNSIISLSKENKAVEQSGKQMLHMVMNILDVQKFEDTTVQLNKQTHSLLEVAESAYGQVNFLLAQKGQSLEFHIDPNYRSDFDWEIIERVLVNLLTNAIKYTPSGKSIFMNALPNAGNEQEFLRFEVRDEGEGIPAENIKHIFSKFYQAEAKSSGSVRSTGLGLTFCKMVVEAHGGEIGAESELKKGSTFFFTIPRLPDSDSEQIESTKKVIDTTVFISLSEADKTSLAELLPKFEDLDIYETSKNLELVQEIESNSEEILKWKAEMENALFSFNESQYKNLVELIQA